MTMQELPLSGGSNRVGIGNADIHARLTAILGDSCPIVEASLAPVFAPPEPEPASTLLKTERLRMLLAGVVGGRDGEEGTVDPAFGQSARQRRAAAWVDAYFRTLLPAAVAPAFVHIRVDGSIGNCRIALRSGKPAGVLFGTAPIACARVGVEDVYGPLLAEHAERVVRTVYATTGLSPRLSWSLAGRTLREIFHRLSLAPALVEAVATHRLVVFGIAANGWFPIHNPLFDRN